jgi:diguanylate cyclase (GGDEF)-like protein
MTARRNVLVVTQIESLAEMLLALLFLVIINVLFFPEDPGFLSVEPHPFLFLTIFIAARYGTFDGFVSGLLCAMVYSAYLLGNTDIRTLFTTLEWHRLVPAYLFVIMGLILGELKEMGNREVSLYRKEAQRLRLQIEDLKTELNVCKQAKEELQKKILSSDDPLAEFRDSATKLQSLDENQTYSAIVDLVKKFCGAETLGVYVKEEGQSPATSNVRRFSLKAGAGAEEIPPIIDSTRPAVALALETKEVVSAVKAQDDSIVLCAPLINMSDETVFGVIAIFKIPFIRVTKFTKDHLKAIAEWASMTLSRAMEYRDASTHVIDDPVTGLRNARFVDERLREEIERVYRYTGSVCLLLIKIMELETLSQEDRIEVMKGVARILKTMLRKVDCVGVYRPPDTLAAVLVSTKDEKAVHPASRISDAFYKEFGGIGSRFAHIYLKMGIGTYTNHIPSPKDGPPPPTPDDLIQQALTFRFFPGK